MKKFKAIGFVLMFAIIAITVSSESTYAVFLPQIVMEEPSDWAKSEIHEAKENGLIPEKVQGNYRNSITREEFGELAISLYEAIGGEETHIQEENPFIDTQNPRIIKGSQLKILSGVGDGIFSPYENITREQVSTIIYNTLKAAKPKYNYTKFEYMFKDYHMISPWAKEAVGYLYGIEVISGVGDDSFNPNGYTTREEAIVLIKRVYDKVVASERSSRNTITVSRSSTSRQDSLKVKLSSIIAKQLGKPYSWGAVGPNSFDCSGLTQYVFAQLGIQIPRTSKEQLYAGTYVSKKDLQYGDLVLFARDGKNINHVGIYVGDGNFAHAPQSGDVVKITTLMSGYYANSYYSGRRVLYK